MVIADRLANLRLPRALDLQKKVDGGMTLNAHDIQFLEDVFRDAQQIKDLVDRHPEWRELRNKVIHLYHEITARALQNERDNAQPSDL